MYKLSDLQCKVLSYFERNTKYKSFCQIWTDIGFIWSHPFLISDCIKRLEVKWLLERVGNKEYRRTDAPQLSSYQLIQKELDRLREIEKRYNSLIAELEKHLSQTK